MRTRMVTISHWQDFKQGSHVAVTSRVLAIWWRMEGMSQQGKQGVNNGEVHT